MTKRNIIQKFIAVIGAVAIVFSWTNATVPAQEPSVVDAAANITKADLHQALLDLTNPWTVMCVAAHPDDEDGTTLTVLRRKYGAHTVSLFSTYGEGGQNAVGPELYEELGVIRAKETLKASEIQGSEPHFLGLRDFGFSKSMEETFSLWNREEALKRMVLKLRELRPDVIITNHDTARGHGHHQATGQLLLEAFDAAADPKRFPEQLSRFKTWQVQRLFVRIFGGAATNAQTPTAKIVSIDPNEMDPVREISFAEQALAALQQHATQGPWPKTVADLMRARRIESGKLPPIRYRLVREAANAAPLPDTAATPFEGLKLPQAVTERLAVPNIDERPLTEFVDQRNRIFDALINWLITNVDAPSLPEDPVRLAMFKNRVNKALAAAAGVSLNIASDAPLLIRNQKNTFAVTVTNAGSKPLQITRLAFSAWGKELKLAVPDHLLADTDTSAAVGFTTPANTPFTVPKAAHLYDELFFGIPFNASAEIDIEGAKFVVNTTKTIDVAPAVEIQEISPSPCVRTEETLGRCKMLNVTFSNHLAAPFRGTLSAEVTSNVTLHSYSVARQVVLGPLETRTDQILFNSPVPERQNLRHLRSSGSTTLSLHRSDTHELITKRKVPLVYANAHVAADLRIGYVPSFDQTLERSLASFGVDAKSLTVDDVQKTELAGYDTIIIDNRAYEAHPGLIAANQRLMQYLEQGGTLIVFYHKDNEWNPDTAKNRPQLAPYPILLGGQRVTDENAPMRLLLPRHRLFNYPNRITEADFKNWIQERGLYYPKEWDKRYAALLSTNDPGEPALRGGLLVGKHGQGNYMYTSMVWYRQLRAGVPGAYRMFANMISYGKNTSANRRAPIKSNPRNHSK
jgi:LmbE family N-acetylglucosaminyl deacetylase